MDDGMRPSSPQTGFLHAADTIPRTVTYAFVGDEFHNCTLALFADADYAGDKTDSVSTSGVFAAVIGPRTYVPIKSISKKQTCSSHSTCEAEVVGMNLGLKE